MDDARSKRLRFLMARLEQLPPSITRDAVLRAAQERVEHPNPWLFSSADDQALDARLESVLDLLAARVRPGHDRPSALNSAVEVPLGKRVVERRV